MDSLLHVPRRMAKRKQQDLCFVAITSGVVAEFFSCHSVSQGKLDDLLELVEEERLRKIADDETVGERILHGIVVVVIEAGDEDAGEVGMFGTDAANELEPVHVGQLDVGEEKVKRLLLQDASPPRVAFVTTVA